MCFCQYFVSLSQVRYEHSYQIKKRGESLSFLFGKGIGLEPIYMQPAGGRLLNPVRTLGSTYIFLFRLRERKMQIESGHRHKKREDFASLFFAMFVGIRSKAEPSTITIETDCCFLP